MKRRIGLLFLLAAVFCLVSAFAETEGDFKYVILEDGTAKITNWSGNDPVVTVPQTLGGATVTQIGGGAFSDTQNNEIILPPTITAVGAKAFGYGRTAAKAIHCAMNSDTARTVSTSDYTGGFHPLEKPEISLKWNSEETLSLMGAADGLVTLNVPAGVTEIKASAFENALDLMTLVLPDSVRRIESNAFNGCANLTLTLPDHISELMLYWNGKNVHPKEIICTPGSATAKLLDAADIAYTAPVKTGVTIRWVGSILTLTDVEPDQTEVTVPEGVTAIAAEAFRRAEALRHVKLPSTLETVEPGVRDTLDGFDSIRVPDGAAVEAEAFWGVGTNRVVIPEGVTALDSAAFAGCPNLLLVALPSTLTDIPDNLLDGSPFAKVTAPAGSEAWNWAEEKGILAD